VNRGMSSGMSSGGSAPRVPRSLLYVPAHNEKMILGAARRGAEAIILDLEDSVPPAAKVDARERLSESVAAVGELGASVVVRVNGSWSLAWRDLEAAAAAGAQGVMLPKVDSPGKVESIGEYLVELEENFGLKPQALLLIIESARGLAAVQEIAAALAKLATIPMAGGSRLTALVPGNEDLSLSLQVEPKPELMAPALWPLITAARAHGHALLGSIGSSSDYRDLAAYRDHVARARSYGFYGVTCIHPAQVEVVNELYSSTGAGLEWARKVIAAFDAGGGESVGVDGQMVDRPVYRRAKRVVEDSDR